MVSSIYDPLGCPTLLMLNCYYKSFVGINCYWVKEVPKVFNERLIKWTEMLKGSLLKR